MKRGSLMLCCVTGNIAAAVSGEGCAEAPSCVDWAVAGSYSIELSEVSDACISRYGFLPNGLVGGWKNAQTSVIFTETDQSIEQDGCKLGFELERVDPLARQLVTIKGDDLIGDGTRYRGSVSIEWYTPELAADTHVDATTLKLAKRTPVCSATAEAWLVPDPVPTPLGAAASAALAGRGR